MAKWYTADELKLSWSAAGKLASDDLDDLVGASKEQCLDYVYGAPEDRPDDWTEPDTIPFSWRRAHLLQIKALHNAEVANPADATGEGDQSVRVYPMGQTIRDLLVPRRSSPAVG